MKLARLLSGLFHPIVMPIYGLFVIFHSGTFLELTPIVIKKLVYLIVFVTTVMLPLSLLPLLRSQRLISGFEMSQHRERILPLFLTSIFYSLGYYLIQRLPVSGAISFFLLAGIVTLLLVLIISVKWKISLHMTGIGGVLGLILAMAIRFSAPDRNFFMIVLLASGLLAYSRLRLNAHTPLQVYCGLALGFFTVLISILMY